MGEPGCLIDLLLKAVREEGRERKGMNGRDYDLKYFLYVLSKHSGFSMFICKIKPQTYLNIP